MQEIFIMWVYMILKNEEDCNMIQVLIVKFHVLLSNCDGKLKEKKESINATPIFYLPTNFHAR